MIRYFPIFLIIIGGYIFFCNIHGSSLFTLDEVKNAQCAYQMYESGDYFVPRYKEYYRTDKPPLHYFFMTLGYSIWGKTAFGARVFSSLMGLLTLLSTYFFVKKRQGIKTAMMTTFILLSCIHFCIEFHLSVPDPYLIFFMTLSLFSFFELYRSYSTNYFLLTYASLGFAILSKGPIAIIILALSFMIYILISKENVLKCLRRAHVFEGITITSFIALPWFIINMYRTNGVWLQGFLFDHNLGRYAQTMESHNNFVVTPIILMIVAFMPYSFHLFSLKKLKQLILCDSNIRWSLSIVIAVISFFMISRTFLPNYILPAYPFIALLIAKTIRLQQNKKYTQYLFILFILGSILATIFLSQAYSLIIYYVWGLTLLFGVLYLNHYLFKKLIEYVAISTIYFVIFLSFIFFQFMGEAEKTNEQIFSFLDTYPDHKLVIYRKFKPTLPFYEQRTPYYAHTPGWVRGHCLEQKNDRILVLSREDYIHEIDTIDIFTKEKMISDIFDGKGYVIYSVDFHKKINN